MAPMMNRKSETEGEVTKGIFEGLIEALADKHSQLDLSFQRTTIKLPRIREPIEVNGLLTLSVHLRDLTEEEKQASKEKNVAMMRVS
jgi:hypothetical protein